VAQPGFLIEGGQKLRKEHRFSITFFTDMRIKEQERSSTSSTSEQHLSAMQNFFGDCVYSTLLSSK